MTSEFARLIYRFGGGRRTIIWLWSLIFLPGTILHEISHFLMAAATGAKTGKIEIFPQVLEKKWEAEATGGGVVLGSVQTQKLNPLRGFLVGLAPFIFGLIILTGLANLLKTNFSSGFVPQVILEIYLFFTIVNSFFPSRSDIKQTLPFFGLLIIVGILALILGLKLSLDPGPRLLEFTAAINFALMVSVVMNAIILCGLMIISRMVKKSSMIS